MAERETPVSYSDLQRLLKEMMQQNKELVVGAIQAATAPNVLEQKKLDEELERERRRNQLSIELGYADEMGRWRKQNSCTHCVYPIGHRQAGQNAPRGIGEWCTGGQVHGNGTITLICNRCQTTWNFKATPEEIQYATDAEHGLLGYEPPPIERCENRQQFLMKPPIKPVQLGV